MPIEQGPAAAGRQDERAGFAAQLLLLCIAATLFYVEAVPRRGGGRGGMGIFYSIWRFGWPRDYAEQQSTYNSRKDSITSEWKFDPAALAIDCAIVISVLALPSFLFVGGLISRQRGQLTLRSMFAATCFLAVAVAISCTNQEYGEPDWQYAWTELFGIWPPITLRAVLVGACVVAEVLYLAAILFGQRKLLVDR